MKIQFYRYNALCLCFIFYGYSSSCQLTTKDFKLCLDNVTCSDTILLITKDQILKSSTIIPNFAWFTIESATVYVGEGNYTSEMQIINLPGNKFNNETKKIFDRLIPGTPITIEVYGHNKQNTQVKWGTLSIRIIK